ncbi:type VII toxin-antitoxin system MntA family adenylyltransferase antitoxin [Sporomusa termitida]|uniref:Polymerase beta, Nucleotidyltransferase n=1 Tax=Sporomusa termitida TaxID=2377 RepID=A0A517DXD2_9FIRM|nr:nucleotidyltransferase domain-containing protein [Sporomusa termitida]QDR82007.1 Polymerase beta, Nucleotidyltransferase [Sporomusa termitida]
MSKDYDLINKLKDFFATRPELLFVWLFGSVATGKTNRFSDVDIAIYISNQNLINDFDWYLELKLKLMDITKREVDLIVLNTASPLLKHVANMQKVVLLSHASLFEAEYSLAVIKEYNDVRYWTRKTRMRYLEV